MLSNTRPSMTCDQHLSLQKPDSLHLRAKAVRLLRLHCLERLLKHCTKWTANAAPRLKNGCKLPQPAPTPWPPPGRTSSTHMASRKSKRIPAYQAWTLCSKFRNLCGNLAWLDLFNRRHYNAQGGSSYCISSAILGACPGTRFGL